MNKKATQLIRVVAFLLSSIRLEKSPKTAVDRNIYQYLALHKRVND